MYEYSYLSGALVFSPFWIYFYLTRSDLRATMLPLSILFGIGGLVSEFVYINDWWNPETMFGTPIGIEDFLFGFFFSGSVAVFYEVIFNKAYTAKAKAPKFPVRFRYIALIFCSTFFGSALIFKMHSFTATVLAFGISLILILTLRKDLIPNAIVGSLFSSFLGFMFFAIPELLNTGWIASTWSFSNLSGNFVFYVPMEDFIWFLMAGAFIAPLDKFWKNKKSTAYIARENSAVIYVSTNTAITESSTK